MDEFFDKIKDGASKAKDSAEKLAKKVVKHTSDAITNTKLSISINEANNKIKDIYSEIGKAIYIKYLDGDITDSEFADSFEQIGKLMEDIDSLNAKKAELKNSLCCDKCGTFNPHDADYCSKCGAALVHKSDNEADAEEYDSDDVITITPQPGE